MIHPDPRGLPVPGETEPAGRQGADGLGGGRDPFDTGVAHSARVHGYWLGGRNN